MNRSMSKEKFLKYIINHPAAIKKIVNPTEDLLVECVTASYRCMDFIPEKKQTEKIITAYLEVNRGYGCQGYLENNKEIAAKLSKKAVKKFLSISHDVIKYFPQATKEMWLETAKGHNLCVDFKDIPKEVLCEELLENLLRVGYGNFSEQIPESLWTPSMLKITLATDPGNINRIPKSLVTKELVMYALSIDKVREEVSIPEAIWDVELAEYAADKTTLNSIPVHLRSKVVCLKSILANQDDDIPSALWKDKEIQMAYVGIHGLPTNGHFPHITKIILPLMRETTFQVETIRYFIKGMDAEVDVDKRAIKKVRVKEAVKNMKDYIKEWIPILSVWPEAIQFIPKPTQTTEHIMAALQSRTEHDDLELIAKSINLAKVSKEMAPMLLNVETIEVKDFITRKFNPPKRVDLTKVVISEIVLDVTPEEFRNINKEV